MPTKTTPYCNQDSIQKSLVIIRLATWHQPNKNAVFGETFAVHGVYFISGFCDYVNMNWIVG